MTKRIYGYLRGGEPIADESIEAVNGVSEQMLITARRGRGRPRLASEKKSVESVRLSASLKSEAQRRAEVDGISVSEVIRRALEQYLRSA